MTLQSRHIGQTSRSRTGSIDAEAQRELTAALKATATGSTLKILSAGLRDYHRSRLRAAGSSKVVAVERTGWKEGQCQADRCED